MPSSFKMGSNTPADWLTYLPRGTHAAEYSEAPATCYTPEAAAPPHVRVKRGTEAVGEALDDVHGLGLVVKRRRPNLQHMVTLPAWV